MVNAFASLSYERAGAGGRLVIASSEKATGQLRVQFLDAVPLHQARRMRKILELSDESVAVLVDHRRAYCLGSCSPGTDVVEISVTDHAQWEISVDGLALMRVAYGQATLPKPLLDLRSLALPRNGFSVLLNSIGSGQSFRMLSQWTRNYACSVKRTGARICSSRCGAVPITPQLLEPADVVRLGRVDGAVLLGKDGFCHAFGVILDGAATGQGDPARGSRYNSAVRYQSTTKDSVLVVISDDGAVNLIPRLEPRVRRDHVEEACVRFVHSVRLTTLTAIIFLVPTTKSEIRLLS